MFPLLRDLLILQDRDIKLAKVQRELEHAPAEEKAIQNRLAEQSRDLEAKKLKSKQIETERKRLELEVGSKKTQLDRYRSQQLQTKKNEEYQALAHEIARTEKEISDLDDSQLELMERYEASQKEVAVEAEKVKQFEAAANSRIQASREKFAVLKKQEETLKAEIAALEPKVDPAALTRYRRILHSKKDVAIVPIVHDNTCSGCHMRLTTQTVLAAKADQSLTSCDDCARIIYWDMS